MDCNKDNEMWEWHGPDYCQDTNIDVPNTLWSVNQNDEDLSYMFDETTPVRACGDLPYHVSDNGIMNKGIEEYREASSQAKRRRMLQFDDEVMDVRPLCSEDMSSAFLKSKEREDSVQEALSDMSQWVAGFADDTSASGSGYEGLDQSSEGWLADCFNDTDMHFSPDDMNQSEACDVQYDITELCNTPPEPEANTVEKRPTRTRRNVVFKGKKSFMKAPTVLTSSVVYPFAFVKPCGMQGAVTLKDINKRILTPPPSKSKQTYEDPSVSYPTSAFSGKPVVGKTKIRTEGGKGSITIMRTKG